MRAKLRVVHATGVGRDDHRLLLEALVGDPLGEHRHRGHVVERDVEEALDLAGVEVHGEDPVDAHASRHLATIRAEIGSRGADFLSWRA